jgi:hypothetical protein
VLLALILVQLWGIERNIAEVAEVIRKKH